jgi:hypothetical protein
MVGDGEHSQLLRCLDIMGNFKHYKYQNEKSIFTLSAFDLLTDFITFKSGDQQPLFKWGEPEKPYE